MDHPKIARVVWDGWNTEHVAKHGVSPEEAEQVLAGETISEDTYKQRLLVIGSTKSGRILTVIVGRVPYTSEDWYVFSARPASRKERAIYRQIQVDLEQGS